MRAFLPGLIKAPKAQLSVFLSLLILILYSSSVVADEPFPNADLVQQDESGHRNIPNYMFDKKHSAGGFFQLTSTNWKLYGPKVGVDLEKYPNAMSAPEAIQGQVAGKMYAETGLMPWIPYNAKLRADLGAKANGGTAKPVITEQSPGRVTRTQMPQPRVRLASVSSLGVPRGARGRVCFGSHCFIGW